MNKSAQQYIEDAIKLYRRRRYQESLDTFELAIEINPTSVRALHGRGFVLAKMKEYKRALESYEQACKLAPNTAKIYLDMAEVFYMLKNYKKSGVSYRKAVELDSNYGSIYRDKTQELFHEAISLRSRGLRGEALRAFRQILVFNPGDNQVSYYISELGGKLPRFAYRESDSYQPQPSKSELDSLARWNNEWQLSPSIHPANCRCPKCWEP